MNYLYLIIFFIFGTFFGSFFTVVGLRLPKGVSFIKGKSHCDKCGEELGLLDMIPILSFFFLKGKCRYCHKKISPLSTYMEFFTGILFTLSYFTFGFSYELLIALGIVALLIIVSVSDMSYYIIPDEVLIFFSIYFFIVQFLILGSNVFWQVLSALFLFFIMYLIMLIGNKIFKRESLGGADIKMMFLFGLILHPLLGVISIFLGSCLALPISLFMLLKQKENIVPFGPFLVIALALIYFTQLSPQIILNILLLCLTVL